MEKINIMRYKTEITLFNSYFDVNDNLTAKSILNILQDVAAAQAEQIGIGFDEMISKQLYWVISRIKIDIVKMPKLNERVIVETWPHEKGIIDFDRDLKITNMQGELLIKGSSKWCVIDIKNRKLQRTDNVNYIDKCSSEMLYTEKFGKIILPNKDLEKKKTYKVSFSDLDHNNHMNNTNYALLVMNVVERKQFKHFEINFQNECLLDDEIELFLVKDEDKEFVVGKCKDKISFVSMIK